MDQNDGVEELLFAIGEEVATNIAAVEATGALSAPNPTARGVVGAACVESSSVDATGISGTSTAVRAGSRAVRLTVVSQASVRLQRGSLPAPSRWGACGAIEPPYRTRPRTVWERWSLEVAWMEGQRVMSTPPSHAGPQETKRRRLMVPRRCPPLLHASSLTSEAQKQKGF